MLQRLSGTGVRRRPSFNALWAHFSVILGDGSVAGVGQKIGGKVGENIKLGIVDPRQGFTDACAIRMSYSFNKAGVTITRGSWNTVSGAGGEWYIYRVADLLTFMKAFIPLQHVGLGVV